MNVGNPYCCTHEQSKACKIIKTWSRYYTANNTGASFDRKLKNILFVFSLSRQNCFVRQSQRRQQRNSALQINSLLQMRIL